MKIPQASCSFETTILISASPDKIWDVLVDFKQWKKWWPYVRTMKVCDAEFPQVFEVTVGTFFEHLTFRGTVTEMKPVTELAFFSEVDLVGPGRFVFTPTTEGTKVVFYWNIATTKQWMNVVALFIRPVFEFSHSVVMRSFAKGLAREVGAALLDFSSVSHDIDRK